MQVYVPLNAQASYAETKPFAHAVAQVLERAHPDLVVERMKKQLRVGKVLVDWSQNDPHKTTVSVYSLRARPRPTVSTPVTWAEVEKAARTRRGDGLSFEAGDVLRRVERMGDLFAPVADTAPGAARPGAHRAREGPLGWQPAVGARRTGPVRRSRRGRNFSVLELRASAVGAEGELGWTSTAG